MKAKKTNSTIGKEVTSQGDENDFPLNAFNGSGRVKYNEKKERTMVEQVITLYMLMYLFYLWMTSGFSHVLNPVLVILRWFYILS